MGWFNVNDHAQVALTLKTDTTMGVNCQITEAGNVRSGIPCFLTNCSICLRVYCILHSAKHRAICNGHPLYTGGKCMSLVLHYWRLTGALSRDTAS